MKVTCTIPTFYCGTGIPCGNAVEWTEASPTVFVPEPPTGCATAFDLTHNNNQWSFRIQHGPAGKESKYIMPGTPGDPTGVYILEDSDCSDAPDSLTVV